MNISSETRGDPWQSFARLLEARQDISSTTYPHLARWVSDWQKAGGEASASTTLKMRKKCQAYYAREGTVTFGYKDYADGSRRKKMPKKMPGILCDRQRNFTCYNES